MDAIKHYGAFLDRAEVMLKYSRDKDEHNHWSGEVTRLNRLLRILAWMES